MNFTIMCINKLIEYGEKPFERQNKIYFKLSSLNKLPDIIKYTQSVEDLRIIPYYLFDDKIMEPYEYILSLRVVDKIKSKINYFLEETGKKNLSEINDNIIELLDNTYYEILKNDTDTFINCLQKYLNFIYAKEKYMLNAFRDEMNSHNIDFEGIFYELA